MQNTNELYDIYSFWHVPWWQTKTFYYALGACAVLALVAIIYALIARYRAKPQHPWEIALEVLYALQQQGHSPEHSDQFYVLLIETLKDYLHDRYNFDVIGMTDQEMLAYLADTQFPKDLLEQLRSIIKGATNVKF